MGETTLTEEMNMDALMAQSSPAAEGEIMTARVVELRQDGILVDVGTKVESFISLKEFGTLPPFKVGDEIPVFVRKNTGTGEQLQVSWKKARELQGWQRILEAFSAQVPLTGRVNQRIKGGLAVDLGVQAFLPASQVDNSRNPEDLNAWVGREIDVLVIECNRQKGSVVVSRRRLLEQERVRKKEALIKDIAVGQVRRGRVTGITSFGAFVDIGGVEGLLHISDIAWRQPARVDQVIKLNDELDLKILKFDPATERLSLGRKQLLPHPWDGLEERLKVGQTVQGKVSSLASFGAFVQIEPGIEGLIHLSEMSWTQRPHHAKEILKVGQEVKAKVISVSRAEEKIGLSLKRMEASPWDEAARLYPLGARLKAPVSRFTAFGAFLKLPNGIEGLLRTQDLSWTRKVKNPSEILKPGEVVEVIVLEINPLQEKLALGLKQLSPDPVSKLRVGDVVAGKIVTLTDFGAFIHLDSGLEVLIRKGEMADVHEGQPPKALAIGEIVTATIIKLQKRERKIEASIRRYERDEQRALMKKYARPSTGPTLGDAIDWNNQPDE